MPKSQKLKLHSDLKIGLGGTSISAGGMLHYLYGWSHDFAHSDKVGLPFWDPDIMVTGEQWEYLNLFGAEAPAIVLAITGSYLLASGYGDMKAINLALKSAANKLKIRLLAAGENLEDKIDQENKLTKLEEELINNHDYEEKTFAERHPDAARYWNNFKKYITLPISVIAHTSLITLIHLAWTGYYYADAEYIGAIREPVLWNYVWFGGASATYAVMTAASYAAFSVNGKSNTKLEKKLKKIKK